MDFIFTVPVDTDVELPHFTLCKWVSSDDPEKNSGEAKCKDDDLSPNKPESPQVQHHGTSQKSSMFLFYVIFMIDAYKESKSLPVFECWLINHIFPCSSLITGNSFYNYCRNFVILKLCISMCHHILSGKYVREKKVSVV